jgi:hypothetical protein
MNIRRALPFVLVLLSGCVFSDIRAPRQYRSSTPSEIHTTPSDPTVEGRSCSQSFLYLVAFGDEGYAAAVRDALKEQPAGAIMYDVRSDIQVKAYVFGLYARVCTHITGRVGKL